MEKIRRASQAGSWYTDNVNEELKATRKFELMDLQVDEAEHSMEMHLPYLAKVFEGYPVKVVPILVGALNVENEAIYGQLLAKYVDDPNNFFSVSSDFCHWGSRFNYMHYDKKHGAIHKSIEALDKMGMDIIETGDPDAFKQYLLDTDNTICGHHPISVFLHMLSNCPMKIKVKFLRYKQSSDSSQCKNMRDSSGSFSSDRQGWCMSSNKIGLQSFGTYSFVFATMDGLLMCNISSKLYEPIPHSCMPGVS